MPTDRPDRSIQAQGIFANAFRVVEDATAGPGQCLLEFLVYSQTENFALVVGKVLVDRGMVLRIRNEITEIL